MSEMSAAMTGSGGQRALAAVLFAGYLDAAYNVMSATNSSPQTTELFASSRADTLWKYVILGDVQVAGAALLGAWIAGPGMWMWPLLGAAGAAVAMHMMYRHALLTGVTKREPTGASPT